MVECGGLENRDQHHPPQVGDERNGESRAAAHARQQHKGGEGGGDRDGGGAGRRACVGSRRTQAHRAAPTRYRPAAMTTAQRASARPGRPRPVPEPASCLSVCVTAFHLPTRAMAYFEHCGPLAHMIPPTAQLCDGARGAGGPMAERPGYARAERV